MPPDATRRWFFLLSLVFWTGCSVASPHPYSIAKGHQGSPAVRTMVVLPLNLVEALPAELQRPSANVSKAIDTYLRAAGKETQSLGLHESRDRWETARREVRQSEEDVPGNEAVARQFVLRLRDEREFDVVVMPSLIYREARIFQGSRVAAWDGVEREYEMVNVPTMYGSIHLMGGVSGKMDGVSLHVFVFNQSGAKVFESFGGIDLVHRMDVGVANAPGVSPMKLKRRPLSDAAVVREGIARAFAPYVTPPATSDRDEG